MSNRILITGANSGIGKESARQFGLKPEVKKIFLGVRSIHKGNAAKKELEEATGRKIFEVIIIDVSDATSSKKMVSKLTDPIDVLVMNAGGIGGKNPRKLNASGTMDITSVNLLGHAALVEELIEKNMLTDTVIYAGSETARGVSKFGVQRPSFKDNTVQEYKKIMNGEFFNKNENSMNIYAYIKYLAALWMSSLAREYPSIRFITVSPGSTSGTNGANDAPFPIRFLMTSAITSKFLLPMMKVVHGVDKGAARYLEVIYDKKNYKSGHFYASKEKDVIGPLIDQKIISPSFGNKTYQDNAYAAITHFIR